MTPNHRSTISLLAALINDCCNFTHMHVTRQSLHRIKRRKRQASGPPKRAPTQWPCWWVVTLIFN